MYRIETLNANHEWVADAIGDHNEFATAADAEACIVTFTSWKSDPDWAEAQYRVKEIPMSGHAIPERRERRVCLRCERCDGRESGAWRALIADEYLVDAPAQHSAALCPHCAAEDDPHHVPGSWLLTWG